MNEAHIIKRLKAGDVAALATLVRRYQVKAVRVAYLITQDRALAEDVVQSAFIRCYQNIDQFRTDASFEPWFMRSVVNAAIRATKQQQRHISIDADPIGFEDLLQGDLPSPEESLEANELRDRVWAAIQQLSPQQRGAVVMRYYLNLSESEMASALDIPKGTVKWRLHAGRKQLKGLLTHALQLGNKEEA